MWFAKASRGLAESAYPTLLLHQKKRKILIFFFFFFFLSIDKASRMNTWKRRGQADSKSSVRRGSYHFSLDKTVLHR